MMTALVDMKPNHDMIDPNFDGYKLSLEPLPVYKVALESGIDEVRLREDQYSYQHVKALGTYNHLTSDPYNSGIFYYVDTAWNIRKHASNQTVPMQPPAAVYQLPDAVELRRSSDRVTVTLQVASDQYMCVCDGTGNLYLLHTGDRQQDTEWKVYYKGTPVMAPDSDTPIPMTLLHTTHHIVEDVPHIECLMLHVHKNPAADNENRAPPFLTCLTWITLNPAVGDDKWELSRTRRLSGSSAPDYCVIEGFGRAIIVASEKPFQFVYDSLHPIQNVEATNGTNGLSVPDETTYAWTQSDSDVTLFFSVPPNTAKPDIAYQLTNRTVELGIKNADILLQGALHAAVDVDGCTWTMSQEEQMNKLELHLEKTESGLWPEVVVGDQRGHLVADMEQIEEIHQRLAHLTSDQWNPSPLGTDQAYNSQQLEACDAYPDTNSSLVRFDGHTHNTTHQANLSSHQWLFNTPGQGGESPCMCVRHDVDGVIWRPVVSGDDTPWQHIATFNAFGYVQASKQQKKFCSCAPDFSFAVICDLVRHIYIYRQPSAINSPLRNRKTGREVSALAKQQLISLDCVENITGLSVHNDKIHVIAGQTLFLIKINTDAE